MIDEIFRKNIGIAYAGKPPYNQDSLKKVVGIETAKSLLKDMILKEVIGEDIREFHDPTCKVIDSCYCSAKQDFKENKLRQIQRTKLNELFEGKDK